jgi:4-azaleucine resistance transporter AzlC
MSDDDKVQPARPRRLLLDGAAAAWPICFGYVPIGLAFGVLAQKAGLSPMQIGLMSTLVFAGSSQFIAVSLMASGAPIATIVATTFMVNLRHFLMSSALSVFLGSASRKKLSLFAYGVTDESFAVNYTRFSGGQWDIDRGLVLNHSANLAWVASTVAGGVGGRFIPAHAFGIDYALISMFICLLVFQIKGGIYTLTAAIAGGLAVAFAVLVPGNAYIVMASVLAAAAGAILRRKTAARGKGGAKLS